MRPPMCSPRGSAPTRPTLAQLTSIEALEGRIAPAMIVNNVSGAITVTGDGADDIVGIYTDTDPANLVIDVDNNGTAELVIPKASVVSIGVTGGGGADQLILRDGTNTWSITGTGSGAVTGIVPVPI